jgi:predicted deacylase
MNNSDYLNYSYYIYRINVTAESDDFEESRMNGQLLAQDYVVSDVIKNDYDLAIDIHSSNGGYVQDPYIFAPRLNDTVAYDAANNVTKALTYVIYYEPASYSSPQYSTIPIDDGGVPAIVFEMRGNPDHSLETEANQFIHVIDKLIL